jgi:glycosyltransferase involved in cell wall biosynthesis
MPLMVGLGLAIVDLFLLFKYKRSSQLEVRYNPIADTRLVVALAAYDDEASIADAVQDFRSHPLVQEVIVVSNNSRDNTLERAREAGATAVNEPQQGYGRCVYRCFQEATARGNELIVLCEGDRTFRAYDLDKFLAYAPHADIVNDTRTVERLRARATQLSTFIYYGNLFLGKLLEAKHLNRSTITDDFNHKSVYMHISLPDYLIANGYAVFLVEPGLCPWWAPGGASPLSRHC